MDIENDENPELVDLSDNVNMPGPSASKDKDSKPSTSSETSGKASMSTER